MRNEVRARAIADAAWEAAMDGQHIHTGGGVRTGDEARARIDISDGTIVRMAANSDFELRELEGQSADAVTRVRLAAGKLWMSVAVTLGQVFEVETPSGMVAVRGSYLSVEYAVATGQMVATCLEGKCRLTGASGKFTDLTDGQQAAIPSVGADPSPALPMDAAQYADWAANFPEAPVPTATSIATLTPTASVATPPATQTATVPARPTTTIVQLNQCSPNIVPAGVIHLDYGVGRWSTPEEAAAAVGDTWPTITLDGQPVTVAERSDPEWHAGGGSPGWGVNSITYITLNPGEYTLTSQWLGPEVETCVLTVTGP